MTFPEGIGQPRRTICPKCGQIQTPGGYDQELLDLHNIRYCRCQQGLHNTSTTPETESSDDR